MQGGKQMLVRIQKQGQEDSKKFYLPVTIKELMLDYMKKHRVLILTELKGWRSDTYRTVGRRETVPKSEEVERATNLGAEWELH